MASEDKPGVDLSASVEQANERLALAQEAAGAGVWDWDIPSGKLSWTPEMFRLFGLDPAVDVASFDAWRARLHPDDREAAEQRIGAAVRDHVRLENEYRIIRPSGEVRWISALGDTTYDPQGQPLRVTGICLDITERKLAEAACRESEARYALALAALDDGLWDWHVPTGNAFFSAGYYSMLGYDDCEFTACYSSWRLLVHPDDIDRVEHELRQCTQSGKGFSIDLRMKMKSGEWRWVCTRGKVVERDADGNALRMVGTLSDISGRKQAEALLRASEADLKRAQAIGKIGSWSYAPSGAFRWSEETYRIYGVSPDTFALSMESFVQLIHPEDRPVMLAWVEACLSGAEPGEMQFRVILPDGTIRYLNGRGELSRDGQGLPLYISGTVQDITDRKRSESELVGARDSAEKANRAKSQFLSTMSHELRTPLNPILGFADLLAESPNLTEEQHVWLRIISQRGQDLLGLIGSVLDLSRIEAEKITLNREPLHLRQTVRDLSESVQPAAGKKGLTLAWDVDAALPDVVLADGFRLRQILLNLLNNAVKFTERGSIVMRVQDGRAARCLREPSSDEMALLFSIRDTGIGIPAGRQTAVFEAFTQADQKDAVRYGGAGLGLAIASRLVELMGGRIWVESVAGRGSLFQFSILVGLSPAVPPPGTGASGFTDGARTRPLNVLIVEDDPSSLRMAEVVVRNAGHRARIAMDGQQAVSMAAAEVFDLILMDIQLPGLDGVKATGLIREQEALSGRHTRIVALTAYAMDGDRERFVKAGMDGYLAKPVLAAQLRELLGAANH